MNGNKMNFEQPSKTYLLYARVSPKGSSWQGGETSIPIQLDECRNYVLSRDPRAKFIEIYDELKSGKNLKRAGMQRIIAELKAGAAWDCLVIWHLDRLTRSIIDGAPLFQALYDHGKGLMSVRQNIDMFSAGGRFMVNIFISAAQYEREMNSERTTAKMISIAKKGKVPYGQLPHGFRRESENRLITIPEETALVLKLFQTYAAGGSMTDMLAQHPELGTITRIYSILRNPLYIGQVKYMGKIYPGEHEPVVPVELWNQVQELLPGKKRGTDRPNAQKYKYIMSGLVHCHCGKMMTNYSVLKKGVRYNYYKCTDPGCKNAINAERLDTEVLEQIRSILKNDDFLTKTVHEYEAAQRETSLQLRPQIDALTQQIETCAQTQESIVQMFTNGLVTPENMAFWNKRLSDTLTEKQALEEQRETLKRELSANDTSILPEILKAAGGWAALLNRGINDYNIKRNLVLSLIQDFRCTSKGEFELKLVMTKGRKWQPRQDSNLG